MNTAKIIKKLREQTGMNRREFSAYTKIPVRTLEDVTTVGDSIWATFAFQSNNFVCCLCNSGLCTRKFSLKELAQMSFVLMSQQGNYGKIISSGIAIGVTGQFATDVNGTLSLVPLKITDFKYKQTICMYYKKDSGGNTARFVSFLRENIKK